MWLCTYSLHLAYFGNIVACCKLQQITPMIWSHILFRSMESLGFFSLSWMLCDFHLPGLIYRTENSSLVFDYSNTMKYLKFSEMMQRLGVNWCCAMINGCEKSIILSGQQINGCIITNKNIKALSLGMKSYLSRIVKKNDTCRLDICTQLSWWWCSLPANYLS